MKRFFSNTHYLNFPYSCSLIDYLFCMIRKVLGAMQLTERLARTSSLQTATEKRPKLARITLSASPGLGQERVSVEPSQAYEVDGGDTKSGRE